MPVKYLWVTQHTSHTSPYPPHHTSIHDPNMTHLMLILLINSSPFLPISKDLRMPDVCGRFCRAKRWGGQEWNCATDGMIDGMDDDDGGGALVMNAADVYSDDLDDLDADFGRAAVALPVAVPIILNPNTNRVVVMTDVQPRLPLPPPPLIITTDLVFLPVSIKT